MTTHEAGKLGAAARRNRERAKVRRVCDEMRAELGLPAVRWPE